ncbi:MAG: SDR family NAD(P)-dependent oxidoreductase [Ignavibacteria bacterium]|nr:SDR family NAD(P)-dependent oxidoreductase [Ignavibacteria bacterium]
MLKILITGASRGIGRALCIEIARNEKSHFALISRNEELLRQLRSELENLGSIAEVFPCDVGNKTEFQDTLKKASIILKGIDLAVLNAGVSYNKWIFEENYSNTFEEIYRTNVFSIAYAIELLPNLMTKNNSKIVILSSLADARGFPSSSAYCSSKSAVTKIAESARIEFKHLGIDVVTVKPGFVKTDMTAKNKFPMPFLMDADESAKIIWKGIKRNKKVISFPLPMVILTRFLYCMPNFLFDFLAKFYKPNFKSHY